MNYKIVICVLIFIIYYLYNKLQIANNKLDKDIIYTFTEKNNKIADELDKEWDKVKLYICDKDVLYKKIYLDDPIYYNWKSNFNIKSIS